MNVCMTATHELGHMFGLQHCIYYECLMMGTNSPAEAARKPAYFCPICYRKLHSCLQFDHVAKAKEMFQVCDKI